MPLPVSAGAAQHRLGPAPLRDSGEDLVPEQAHQVEKGGAVAGKGGRGGARLFHITSLIAPWCLLLSHLQPSLLSAAHTAPPGALSPLLCVYCVKAQRDCAPICTVSRSIIPFQRRNGLFFIDICNCDIINYFE